MRYLILLVAAFALCACETFSPEQKMSILHGLDAMLENGTINQVQYDALRQTLESGNTAGLTDILIQVGTIAGSVILSLLGVNVWRGGINTRKGTVSVSSVVQTPHP